MLNPSRTLLIAVSTAVLALSGCGGSGDKATSKAEYKKEVTTISQDFRSQVTATQGKISSATDTPRRLKALDEFRNEFSSVASRIDKITPPKNAQDEQDAVVAAFRKGAGDLGKVQDAIRSKNAGRIKSTAAAFQTDATAVQTAVQKLSAVAQ
jgi:hypothetical protein